MADIAGQLQGIKNKALEIKGVLDKRAEAESQPSSSLRTLSSIDSSATSDLNSKVNDSLGGFFKSDAADLKSQTKTIMETFKDRKTLAEKGGAASRELINRNASDNISAQLDANSRDYINAQEGRSGFGTQTAAVKFLEDTGYKRVRQLEKDRDSLLLQSKVLEAQRLDDLITKEQTAITEARTNWVNNLLNISSETRAQNQDARATSAENRAISAENRAVLGFETPEEARQRDLAFNSQQAEQDSVRELLLAAPEVGITVNDTFESAVEKYRNSEAYQKNRRLGELEIQQLEASIANTRSITSNRGSSGTGSGGSWVIGNNNTSNPGQSIVTDNSGSGETLDNLAGRVFNLISSENGKEAFRDSYERAQTAEDKLNTITSAVVSNAPAAVEQDFISTGQALANIDLAIDKINSGVQTGFLNNAKQYTYNIFGQDYDKDLTEIQQLITASLQPYRSSITGAAWGRQETAEYEKLFGTTKYSPEELITRLEGLKGIMQRGRMNVITSALAPFGNTRGISATLSEVAYPDLSGSTSQTTSAFEIGEDMW